MQARRGVCCTQSTATQLPMALPVPTSASQPSELHDTQLPIGITKRDSIAWRKTLLYSTQSMGHVEMKHEHGVWLAAWVIIRIYVCVCVCVCVGGGFVDTLYIDLGGTLHNGAFGTIIDFIYARDDDVERGILSTSIIVELDDAIRIGQPLHVIQVVSRCLVFHTKLIRFVQRSNMWRITCS